VPVPVPEPVPEPDSEMVTVVFEVVWLNDIVIVYVLELSGGSVVEVEGAEVKQLAITVFVDDDVSVLVMVCRR
jgi:hypothetical protein